MTIEMTIEQAREEGCKEIKLGVYKQRYIDIKEDFVSIRCSKYPHLLVDKTLAGICKICLQSISLKRW